MGGRLPDPSDRRVQRTRRALREALVALMLEKGWDSMSVQDICDRADVGRSTFYTHFADKEELLVGGFHDLREMIRAGLARTAASDAPLGFARGMIDHAHENQRLFKALVGKRSGLLVLRRFRDLVVTLVREDLARLREPAAPTTEATVHFVAGAFLELLTWWLDARSSLEPSDVERLFLRMASQAIQATGSGGSSR
jgi:AcrR family transcriptional regulator